MASPQRYNADRRHYQGTPRLPSLKRPITGRAVRVDAVTKSFGGFDAVDSVSLTVEPGSFVSLLGPSGSGKTTLLMMIAGFERPNAGRILIDDQDITLVAPNKRRVGMVFQKYALFPHMTIAQNVAFPLKMKKIGRDEIAERVGAALALVRLEDYGRRMPSQLSGGQQQRIAVARALVSEPPVLLMDEPLGALDKKLREQMQIEIKNIQERLGVTVIYVTHDQEEALTMSDVVAVLNEGRLIQVGSPVALYQAPRSAFVADFIGKMNFMEGEFLGADGDVGRVRLSPDVAVPVNAAAPPGSNGSVANGTGVKVAIRPESIRLAPRGHGGQDAVPGTVDAAIFVGSFRVFLVAVAGRSSGEPLHVQLPAEGNGSAFARGDDVDILFEPSAVRLYPDGVH